MSEEKEVKTGFAENIEEENPKYVQDYLKAKGRCPGWIPPQEVGSYGQKGLEISLSRIVIVRGKCTPHRGGILIGPF